NSDNISDFTYSPKSDSIDSDSTEEYVKFQQEWLWIIDGMNILLMLTEYHQTCLAKAKCNSMNNSVEILETGVREGFDRKLWATIIDNIGAEFVLSLLSDQDILSARYECFYTDKSQKRIYTGHRDTLDKMIDDGVESSDVIICGLLV
ncbi:10509_t:CDS:2, partial [Scutellospora calospora]